MADGTKIEWTDATWNPITGCSVVSPGCTNCYAMKLAGTRLKHHPSREGLTRDSKAGPVWTGEVRFNPDWLDQPLRWKKPRMIFVCAHGDLFAEGVKDEWLDQIFAVMALAPQHTFQVLTKRPERMRQYLFEMQRCIEGDHKIFSDRWGTAAAEVTGSPCSAGAIEDADWPLPNVWLGVSVEDQKRANERIPLLLDTPAAIRWISAEPLLGPVYIPEYMPNPLWNNLPSWKLPELNWVVAGGESGGDVRPMHPGWARALRDQCAAAGVPFLFKQWGQWAPQFGAIDLSDNPEQSRRQWAEWDGDKWEYWDRPQWCDDLDPEQSMVSVGKKTAGRLLDGIEHNGFPEVRR